MTVTNNIAETFNSWIRNEKSEPIIPLMDRIRQKIMKKHKIRRDLVTTMKGRILPLIITKDLNERIRNLNCHSQGA